MHLPHVPHFFFLDGGIAFIWASRTRASEWVKPSTFEDSFSAPWTRFAFVAMVRAPPLVAFIAAVKNLSRRVIVLASPSFALFRCHNLSPFQSLLRLTCNWKSRANSRFILRQLGHLWVNEIRRFPFLPHGEVSFIGSKQKASKRTRPAWSIHTISLANNWFYKSPKVQGQVVSAIVPKR